MSEKLKASILVLCFLRHTGFAPDNVITLDNGEICVSANGYGLAWSWPSVRVVDELAYNEFQSKIAAAVELYKNKVDEIKEIAGKRKSQLEIF